MQQLIHDQYGPPVELRPPTRQYKKQWLIFFFNDDV